MRYISEYEVKEMLKTVVDPEINDRIKMILDNNTDQYESVIKNLNKLIEELKLSDIFWAFQIECIGERKFSSFEGYFQGLEYKYELLEDKIRRL